MRIKPIPGEIILLNFVPQAGEVILEFLAGSLQWQLDKFRKWQTPRWN